METSTEKKSTRVITMHVIFQERDWKRIKTASELHGVSMSRFIRDTLRERLKEWGYPVEVKK